MPPTLRTLIAMPKLGLRVLAAEEATSVAVSWVAVSELVDPTPFLEGGELLLTTGMRLPSEAREVRAYVDRLVDAGLVGLGLGVGLGHDAAPATLVRAAERRGLPLLEVPRPTPFIAISKVVSDLLAAEQSEATRRAFEAQRELTQAALHPQRSGGVVQRLARELDGWAIMLDASGRVVHAFPESAADRAAALQPELDLLRSAGLLATRTLADSDEQIVIHPIGTEKRTRGFLAVGLRPPVSSMHHTVINMAVALLCLDMEKSSAQLGTERRLRSACLSLLLDESGDGLGDGLGEAAALLGGSLPTDAARIALLCCPERDQTRLLELIEEDVTLVGAGVLSGSVGGHLIVLLPDSTELLERLCVVVASRPGWRVGIGGAAEPQALKASVKQAEQALAAGARAGQQVASYDTLAQAPLLELLDTDAVRGFAAALLEPLDRYEGPSRTDLVASLRAYLAHNGQWDPAAAELGVHRHTLRYRMRRIAELLGRDLDSPSTRMELWLALTARERFGSAMGDNS
jgi:purine catabolism regulator